MKNSNKKINYLNYLKTGLFYIAVGILLLYIMLSVFLPSKTIDVFGFKPYVVVTESMEPEINVNDLIFVKNANFDELEIDDIITFEADINFDGEKEVVTHYIYSITENGDGTLTFRTHPYFEDTADYIPDYWVLGEADILGEYMFKVSKLGAVVQFMNSPFGIAAMIVNVGVIAGIVYIIKKSEKK